MYTLEEKLKIIDAAHSFDDLKNIAILPEPCGEDGYYFISYSHRDFKQVIPDILAFQKAGIKIWYDRGLETGISWFKDVSRKIDSFRCKGVILYSSKSFCKSASCARELAQVIESKKSALVIQLQDCAPTGLMPDATVDYECSINEKLSSLRSLPPPKLYEFMITRLKGIGACAILVKVNDRNVTHVEIPTYVKGKRRRYRVRGISENAFSFCQNLSEVVIPDGWTCILSNAFSNCPSLQHIVFGHPGKYRRGFQIGRYGVINGSFINCPELVSIKFPTKKRRNEYILFSGTFQKCTGLKEMDMSGIGVCMDDCFSYCTSLESIALGPSQNHGFSGRNAFYGCSSLESVTFSSAWKEKNLPGCMFMYCSSLKAITFPHRLKSISDRCFAYCVDLKEVCFPTSMRTIHATAFEHCKNLKTVMVSSKIVFPTEGKLHLIDEVFRYAETFYIKEGITYLFANEFERIPCAYSGYIAFRKVR